MQELGRGPDTVLIGLDRPMPSRSGHCRPCTTCAAGPTPTFAAGPSPTFSASSGTFPRGSSRHLPGPPLCSSLGLDLVDGQSATRFRPLHRAPRSGRERARSDLLLSSLIRVDQKKKWLCDVCQATKGTHALATRALPHQHSRQSKHCMERWRPDNAEIVTRLSISISIPNNKGASVSLVRSVVFTFSSTTCTLSSDRSFHTI